MQGALSRRIAAPLLAIIVLIAIIPTAFYAGMEAGNRGGAGQITTVTSTYTTTITYITNTLGQHNGETQGSDQAGDNIFIVENGVVRPGSWSSIDSILSSLYGTWQPVPRGGVVGIPEEPILISTPVIDVAPQTGKAETPVAGPDAYSRTNVRVEGIDEPDIVKINGTHAFIGMEDTLYFAKIWPPEEMEILDKATLKELVAGVAPGVVVAYNVTGALVPVTVLPPIGYKLEGIYLAGDGSAIALVEEAGQWIGRTIIVKYRPGEGVAGVLWVTGGLVDSRLLNDTIIVVTNQQATYTGARPLVNGTVPPPDSVAVTGTPQTYVNVLKVDADSLNYSYAGVLGPRASAIYLTLDGTLYIAQSTWRGPVILNPVILPAKADAQQVAQALRASPAKGPTTMITRIDALAPRVEASTILEGRVANTWMMDEYRGYLRVVADRVKGDSVSLYVLNASSLETVARLDSIAVNEDVYGVRFMGDMVYFVTFRRVDPLFAINLSNPANPQILGYLKAPGFDDYLHPLPGGMLLGIGYESRDGYRQVRITIYNVTSAGAPEPVDRLYIEGKNSWSPVLEVPKGYRLLDFYTEKNLIILPVVVYDWEKSTHGYAVIHVDTGKGSLSLRGIVEVRGWEGMIKAFHADDILYTAVTKHVMIKKDLHIEPVPVNKLVIRAYNISTLQLVGEVEEQ